MCESGRRARTVLVVGGGGREHALVRALARSPERAADLAAPGQRRASPRDAEVIARAAVDDHGGVVALARGLRRSTWSWSAPRRRWWPGLATRCAPPGVRGLRARRPPRRGWRAARPSPRRSWPPPGCPPRGPAPSPTSTPAWPPSRDLGLPRGGQGRRPGRGQGRGHGRRTEAEAPRGARGLPGEPRASATAGRTWSSSRRA